MTSIDLPAAIWYGGGSGVRIPSAPQNSCRSEAVSDLPLMLTVQLGEPLWEPNAPVALCPGTERRGNGSRRSSLHLQQWRLRLNLPRRSRSRQRSCRHLDWRRRPVIDLVTGNIDTLFTECGGEPFRAPHDLVFDADGGINFTYHGSTYPRHQDRGGLYYISPDFTEIREIAYPLGRPNGVAFSPDGSRVYVADTMTAELLYWDIESRGVLRPGVRDGGASFLWRVPAGGTLGLDLSRLRAEHRRCRDRRDCRRRREPRRRTPGGARSGQATTPL